MSESESEHAADKLGALVTSRPDTASSRGNLYASRIPVAIGRLANIPCLGLKAVLANDRQLELVGTGLAPEALRELVEHEEVRVVILDEAVNVAKVAVSLRSLNPDLGVVVLMHDPAPGDAPRLFASGVTTCLSTDTAPFAVRSAIRFAAEGKKVFARAAGTTNGASREANVASLTPREREVLELIVIGSRRAEIALALRITEHTVASHMQKVFRKMEVSGRDELVGCEFPRSSTADAISGVVTVPADLVGQLRNGLHNVLSVAASEVSSVADRANRERHPEWYDQPLERFTRTCALLDAMGWGDSEQPVAAQINFGEHRLALIDALDVAHLLADAELEEIDAVDAQRLARGEAPKRAATLEWFRRLHVFAAGVQQLEASQKSIS
jgi:DNA-binding NarL/FixJ family response regulator